MKKWILLFGCLLMFACSNNQQDFDQRIDAAIKLCQSHSAKAYSTTEDGLRIMCQNGSSFIIRDDTSIDDIVELDDNYCLSMGIRDFISTKEGQITLTCKDNTSYVL